MITDTNSLREALFEHVEAGKDNFKCFCAIQKQLPPGIKREVVDAECDKLRNWVNDETEYEKFAYIEFKDRIRFLNQIAQMVTIKALDIKTQTEALKAEPCATREEFVERRKKIMVAIEEINTIEKLLANGPIDDPDRVDALLKILGEPADLVNKAEELYDL